ncbi:MAG: helix-turn-helix domain-containing protein [Parcubacteria group bacterium]|nr:helix-turn-helix domain-containing protein [Parcubacteria group bacterium]
MVNSQRSSSWKAELAERLKRARGAETQDKLSQRSGISHRTICHIETQQTKNPPRASTIARLAIATGSDVAEWLSLVGISVSKDSINQLRGEVNLKVRWDELEPAEQIKQELREYVDASIQRLELRLSTTLRKELADYLDSRVDLLERRITNLQREVKSEN